MEADWHGLHEATCISEWAAAPPPSAAWLRPQYKCYQRFRHVHLANPAEPISTDFKSIIANRRSDASIGSAPSSEQLSAILQLTVGSSRPSDGVADRRPYPSAGGLFPVELYLIAPARVGSSNQVEDALAPGKYHLCVRTMQLEILADDVSQAELAASFDRPSSDAVYLVLTGVPRRTCSKYGTRGYRYVLLEAGHIGQQVYLACASQGVKCCAVGAFVERVLAEQLFLRPEVEVPVYAFQIGL